MKLSNILVAVFLIFTFGGELRAQEAEVKNYKWSIDFSPLIFLSRVYDINVGYKFTDNDEVSLGLCYQNIKYDFGETHAPCIEISYRRFIWKGLNIEYKLFPAYNSFYENTEKKYYNGFELWNEFRPGYIIDFSVADLPCYVNLGGIVGFGLIQGNKPQSFKDYYKNEEKIFVTPYMSLGIKF